MSWKTAVVRGSAIAWAVALIAVFVVFAGVSVMLPSTKSGRIHVSDEVQEQTPLVEPATQPSPTG